MQTHGRRLDRDTSRVKCDALADENERRGIDGCALVMTERPLALRVTEQCQ